MAEGVMSSRIKRQPKKRTLDEGSSSSDKRYRRCENSGCPSEKPVCCAELSNGCTGDRYTSRWYHISNGEHFCNACFDHMYRSHKDGYEAYAKWKFDWGGCCQREASTKTYVAEMVMAYWVKCKKCGKWRPLPRTKGDLTPDLAREWCCKLFSTSKKAKARGPNPCALPEDERVSEALAPGWLSSLFEPPLLKHSPAAPYLKSYFSDGVGISPVLDDEKGKNESNTNSSHSTDYLQPFYNPDVGESALTFRPDTMEQEEEEYFPFFASTREGSIIYLTLRNVILALWAAGCEGFQDCLTKDEVANNIITRGLARIPLIQEAGNILRYLSIKGIVNHGITGNIEPPLSEQKLSVLIIGAGAAGLSAARHLHKFGVKVTVLEARNRIGGRVSDDLSLGCCVGKGAQILTGCINNPISVLCQQLGLNMKHISGHCDLLNKKGQAADMTVDKKVEFHFNSILDAIAEWRKGKTEDMPLQDRIQEMHKLFLEETQIEFSEEENQLLQFHLGNLEYACAAPLGKVSTLHWDQNEVFPQFAGDHTLLVQGCEALLKGLSKNLNIELNCQVSEINYSQGEVVVTTKKGTKFISHKVIVTLPLAVLKSGSVKFTPDLPAAKVNAINNLGAGLIEKVALKFSRNFWSKKIQGANFFGRIPSSRDNRSSCAIFYDLSRKESSSPKKSNILMTVLSGDFASNTKDEEIIKEIIGILKGLFPEETIPKPDKYIVSHWGSDPYAGMAYSFVPLGSSGQDYDDMASTVNKIVHFAGEATNRQFPQTVTGAYLSGIREAERILFELLEDPL